MMKLSAGNYTTLITLIEENQHTSNQLATLLATNRPVFVLIFADSQVVIVVTLDVNRSGLVQVVRFCFALLTVSC